MKVGVFGGSGDQGQAQVRQLKAAGHIPVIMTRKPDAAGAESIFADYRQPDSLVRALEGLDALFLTLPSTSFNAAPPLIEAAGIIANAAARSDSVRVLVFNTSLPVTKEKAGLLAQDARVEMRTRVLESGVPAIVLQPVVFLDNLLKAWAWPAISQQGKIIYPHSETLDVSWICLDNLGMLMIAAMERPHLAGRVFDVGGPETVRGPVLAQILSKAWGRPLTFESQSIDAYGASMYKVFETRTDLDRDRLIAEMIKGYQRYNNSPDRPFQIDMGPVLKDLPARLWTIEEWAKRQTLKWP